MKGFGNRYLSVIDLQFDFFSFFRFLVFSYLSFIFLAASFASTGGGNNSDSGNHHRISKKVVFAAWGGSSDTNEWINNWLIPAVKARLGIELIHYPVNDTQLAVQKVIRSRSTDIDILWVNGENFKFLKEANALLPFTDQLSSFKKYYNLSAPENTQDFGLATDKLEAPWGRASFGIVHRTGLRGVSNEGQLNIRDFEKWLIKNPGKFTFPSPPDFTGSAWFRQLGFLLKPELYRLLLSDIDRVNARKNWQEIEKSVWEWFSTYRRYLWKEGKQFPLNSGQLEKLFVANEIDAYPTYYPLKVEREILNQRFPKTTLFSQFREGALSNTHFLAIPRKTDQATEAIQVVNLMLSPHAQYSKMLVHKTQVSPRQQGGAGQTSFWGDLPAMEVNVLEKALKKSKVKGGVQSMGDHSPRDSRKILELPAQYTVFVEREWKKRI